jgi:hypothetical protein
MKRMHILLRLFVLAAMTLSFGETVWASMCASMSMVAVSDAGASDRAMQDMPGMPGMPADREQQEGDDEPWCPLGPAAVAQGCLMAASLPAPSAEPFAPADVSTADVVFVAAANDLLYDATLFHPPRA